MGFKLKWISLSFLLSSFAGLFVLVSFCPLKRSSHTIQHGWAVYIGKRPVLIASKNDRGDTAYINRENLDLKDSLFVHEYITGGLIKPPQVNLRILQNETLLTDIKLTTLGGINFYPLIRLNELSNIEKLTVEIHSSFNHYYPEFDQARPMCTLIIS